MYSTYSGLNQKRRFIYFLSADLIYQSKRGESLFNNYTSASNFVLSSNYFIIFIAIVIEGPMVTTAAAFAASLGYFNIYMIFLLSIFGNIVGDIIHYYLGRILRNTIIDWYIKYFKIKKPVIKKLDKKIHNNLIASMVLIKSTPPLSTLGLLLIGASRVKFWKFLIISLLTVLPLSIFYTVLGFYFGYAIKTVLAYFQIGEYAIFFVVIACIAIYFLYKLVRRRVIKKWAKEGCNPIENY